MKDQLEQFIEDASENNCEVEMAIVLPIQSVLGPYGRMSSNFIQRWNAARRGATYRAMVGYLAAMIIRDDDAMDAYTTWLTTEPIGKKLRERVIHPERRVVRECVAIGARVVMGQLPSVSTDSIRAHSWFDDDGKWHAQCDLRHSIVTGKQIGRAHV